MSLFLCLILPIFCFLASYTYVQPISSGLFLRKTASFMEKSPVRLSLFLGSNYPINQANEFEGLQSKKFTLLIETGANQFFKSKNEKYSIGMFADIASVGPCVSCHNKHKDSPKTDWKLNDIMGAATWMFPGDSVSINELIEIIAAVDKSYRETFDLYLTKEVV